MNNKRIVLFIGLSLIVVSLFFHLLFGPSAVSSIAEKSEPIAEQAVALHTPSSEEQDAIIEQLTAEKSQLEKAQDELIRRVINYRNEIKQLQGGEFATQIGELERERDQLAEKLEVARMSIQKLSDERVNSKELVERLSRLQKKIREQDQQKAKSQNNKSVLEMKVAKIESELASEQQKKVSLMQEIEQLRKKEKHFKAQLSQTERLQQVKISELTAKLTASATRSQELDNQVNVLAKQLEATSKKLVKRNQEIEQYAKKFAALEDAKKNLETKLSFLEIERKENKELESKLAEKTKGVRALQEEKLALTNKLNETARRSESYAQKIETLEAHLNHARKEVASHKQQLAQTNARLAKIPELERTIVSLENDLLMRKTEEELLGGTAEPIVRGRLSQKRAAAAHAAAALRKVSKPARPDNMLIVEVNVGKAKLRNGPGKEHGVMMHVSKGARLTVEDKLGEWYRVLTPTGARAYVSSEVVEEAKSLVGVGSSRQQETTIIPKKPVRNVSHSRSRLRSPKKRTKEDEAMEFLRSSVNGR